MKFRDIGRSTFRRSKFWPLPSDLFQNLYPSQFELIWINPRLWIRMNQNQFFNPNKSEVWIIRNDSDWEFYLNYSDLRFIRIKNFIQIHSDWKSRIESDWILIRTKNLLSRQIDFQPNTSVNVNETYCWKIKWAIN